MVKQSRARPNVYGIDSRCLHDFLEALELFLEDAPNIQRTFHEEIAVEMKAAVDSSIRSALTDRSGHVQSWQKKHVGSGGGYAAIRPAKGSVRKGKQTYKVAAITTYLELGHKIPRPSGPRSDETEKNYKYRQRVKNAYVNGRHFYRNTQLRFERGAIARAERVADNIARRLNGG